MPHKCTRCEKIFKDGAVEILNGCPNCGWNKFLFVHDETPAVVDSTTEREEEQPAKKFLKEIDEFLADQGVKVDEVEKMEQEPEGKTSLKVSTIVPRLWESWKNIFPPCSGSW